MAITLLDTVLRMGASVLLGAVIGYERERSGRAAGLRTHLLVSLASATFMLVSTHFVYYQNYGKDDLISADASRIASCVVSGIGFLGAGAILKTGLGVQGLTTAAGLWLTSAVGLAAGGGMYVEAALATGICLGALVVLRWVVDPHWQLLQRHLIVVLGTAEPRPDLTGRLRAIGAEAVEADYDEDLEAGLVTLELDVRFGNIAQVEQALTEIRKVTGVQRITLRIPS